MGQSHIISCLGWEALAGSIRCHVRRYREGFGGLGLSSSCCYSVLLSQVVIWSTVAAVVRLPGCSGAVGGDGEWAHFELSSSLAHSVTCHGKN